MSKSNKKYHHKHKKPFPYFPLGIGLLLIGFASLAMYSPKNSNAGATTNNFDSIDYVVPMEVNYAAPELSLRNIKGEMESLAEYQDSVVLVNNWATWCPPCKAEMPTLVTYHNQHTADGFSVIAIEAGEPVELVSEFAQGFGMTFPVWLDPDGKSTRAFRNGTLPNSYVIDRMGTVRYAWTGEISMAMLEKYVTPLITGNN